MVVEEATVGSIDHGLVVLVGVTHADTNSDVRAIANKVAGLRIFTDDDAKMNRSVVDSGGAVLVVSQFTLYGDARKGRRPSFVEAARPDVAAPLVEQLAAAISAHGVPVATGVFGAHMDVELVNDGPVTVLLETRDGKLV